MLEVKDLCKTYRSRDGVVVEATKNISLRFPERGMVFILGRSGSGKSTLLHLLGGLDRYDSGDIIIHGTSTKDFSNAMMDSYRNTYVGFIFQDYNVLPEFNVGANIALALELQGKRATNERINELLAEVGLENYAKRRPNELSGGQLQRVAIARALIKDPDIILADEPTGALDSTTGRDVFETLKKLSKRKLVIIVSHDRDYSEQYADRIIELADGCVISDEELKPLSELSDVTGTVFRPEDGITVERDGLMVDAGYVLTDEDREKINRYLELQKDGNVLLTDGSLVTPKKERFFATDENAIVSEGKTFSLIKSKLPWKRSFGIGVNSIRHRKLGLFFTVLLSVAALTLFAIADTFAAFDHNTCATDSLNRSGRKFLALQKQPTRWEDYESFDYLISDEEIAKIEKDTGVEFVPAYGGLGIWFVDKNMSDDRMEGMLYPRFSIGTIEVDDHMMSALGATLVKGRLPVSENEICISSLAADSILRYNSNFANKTYDDILESFSGKSFRYFDTDLVIVGIIDIPVDVAHYMELFDETKQKSEAEMFADQIAMQLCQTECAYGLPAVVFCAPGYGEYVAMNGSPSVTLPETQIIRAYAKDDEDTVLAGFNTAVPVSMLNASEIVSLKTTEALLADESVLLLSESEVMNLLYDYLPRTEDGSPYDWQQNTPVEERREEYARLLTVFGADFAFSDEEGNTYKLGGIVVPDDNSAMWKRSNPYVAISDKKYQTLRDAMEKGYSSLYAKLPSDNATLRRLVDFMYEDHDGTSYDPSAYELLTVDMVSQIADTAKPVLRWIGIVLAAFSAVLFAVFIANSILHKKQEIGVLRALGARSLDVYRIFLCETAVIAFVNGLLATLLARAIVNSVNNGAARSYYTKNLELLHFGVRQTAVTFGIAALVAIIATFLPVWGIARRKPIDVIRGR